MTATFSSLVDMVTPGNSSLTDARKQLAQQLQGTLQAQGISDVAVSSDIPDAISPPAMFVAWGIPWIAPTTHCLFTARLEVVCVAARLEPGGSYDLLELMAGLAVLAGHGKGYTFQTATAPYPMQLGGNSYLAASVNFMCEVE